MAITIIVGKPGAGKTLFATNVVVDKLINSFDDYIRAKREIKRLKNGGYRYLDNPPQRHLCYADYEVKINSKLKAYSLDGFKFGLPNPYFETQFIPPYATLVFDEAQRYYDSRNAKSLRPEVYNAFQIHRQNHYNIILVCQRLANIDVNIRALADKVIVIDELKTKTDEYGRIKNITWITREFEAPDVAEDYCNKKDNPEFAKLGKKVVVKTNLPLFRYYNSYSNKAVFYNRNEFKNYDYELEKDYKQNIESFQTYNSVHSFSAPQGYWKSAEWDKKINKQMGVT